MYIIIHIVILFICSIIEFYNMFYSFRGPIARVGLGMLKRSDDRRHWWIREVLEIILYPEYESPSKYHDIALLVIEDRL